MLSPKYLLKLFERSLGNKKNPEASGGLTLMYVISFKFLFGTILNGAKL